MVPTWALNKFPYHVFGVFVYDPRVAWSLWVSGSSEGFGPSAGTETTGVGAVRLKETSCLQYHTLRMQTAP